VDKLLVTSEVVVADDVGVELVDVPEKAKDVEVESGGTEVRLEVVTPGLTEPLLF